MKPHPALVGAFIMITVIGMLVSLSFFSQEVGTGDFKRRGIFVLMVTGILDIFLIILATSKLWFPHLWKKNSTHERHKHHTRHHPSVRDNHYRNRRR